MVFGWGKKKVPKTETEEFVPSGKSISLDDIGKITDEIEDGKTKKLMGQAEYFRKNFETKRNEIIEIIKELEKDDLNVEDLDKHLQILVVRGKKLVISTIKKETSEKLPGVDSYENIVSLNNKLNHELKHVGDVLGRQSRVIHIFAKKYANKLKGNLASLNSERDELQKFIDEYSNLKDAISYIEEKIYNYKESKKNITEFKNRIEELKNKNQNLEDVLASTEQKIKNLKEKKEYLEYLDTKKKIESFSAEENHVKNKVNNQFTKISRPLGKYVYISSLGKSEKQLMETLVERPFEVMAPSNKEDIVKILYAVKKGVEAGSVSVKDISKSSSQIDETIEMIDELIKEKTEFFQKKRGLEKNLEVFNIDELKREESNLNKNLTMTNDNNLKIKELEKEISDTTRKLSEYIEDLEKKLNGISRTRYHISA